MSCSEGDEECFTPPPPFFADIRNEEDVSILSQYKAEDIALYYLDERSKSVNVDFYIEGFLISGDLPFISKDGVTSFYLEVNDVVDTLVVEVLEDQSLDDCTAYFFNYVGFNGKAAELDTVGQRGIYILTRE